MGVISAYMAEDSTITIPLQIGPPKYQTTIPKNARQALGCDGETVILEAELTVKRVLEEGNNGGDS
jgi:hypothetical protein